MPKYRLLKSHYLGTVQYPAGAVVDWDGPKSSAMELVKDPNAPEPATPEAKPKRKARAKVASAKPKPEPKARRSAA